MTTPARDGLRPLAESFPRSHKVAVGDLQVPARDITLTNGDVVRVYDTTGPQGHDVRTGLPLRRAPWIEPRVRREHRQNGAFDRHDLAHFPRSIALRAIDLTVSIEVTPAS